MQEPKKIETVTLCHRLNVYTPVSIVLTKMSAERSNGLGQMYIELPVQCVKYNFSCIY